MRKLLLLFSLLTLSCCLSAQDKEKMLTVLFTNDSHAMAWQYDEPGNPGIGGLAARKTLIDQIKAEVQGKGGNIMILDAGDITLGDPRSNVCHNRPFIQGMNLIGYDAMTIGNHEFNFGLDVFYEMKKTATFPFLSANIYKDGGTKAVADEYIEKKFDDGLKVAVLGITTRETEVITGIGLQGNLVMTDPIQEAKTRIPLLKAKNDIVIILSHLGYYETEKSFDGYYGDNYLAKAVPGVSLIIGGHTQFQMKAPVKIDDTYIVQTEGEGKWLGRFDFYISGNKITKTNYKLYPINLKEKIINDKKITYKFIDKEIPENKTMLEMLEGFKCEFSEEKITTLDAALEGNRDVVRSQESELGDIITDIIKDKVKADIALINSGSIRQGLNSGNVTERDIYNVFPFADTIYTGKIKGSELQEVLDYFAEKGQGAGGFLQISGFSVKLYKNSALDIKINGQPLDKKKTYSFAINSFVASGGDGYAMLRDLKTKKDTGYNLPAALVEYLKKNKKFPKPQFGRIFIVK